MLALPNKLTPVSQSKSGIGQNKRVYQTRVACRGKKPAIAAIKQGEIQDTGASAHASPSP
jgi:hypothetical protein